MISQPPQRLQTIVGWDYGALKSRSVPILNELGLRLLAREHHTSPGRISVNTMTAKRLRIGIDVGGFVNQ